MSRERSEEVMRRYLTEVVAQGKLELIDELAAEDMVDHTQSTPGRAGLVQHVTGFRSRNPDVTVEVERIIADENEVVGIWTWRATPVGEMYGVRSRGKPISVKVASVFRLRDGLLVDYEVISDGLGAVRQMGAEIRDP